jgi:hypothetical protein
MLFFHARSIRERIATYLVASRDRVTNEPDSKKIPVMKEENWSYYSSSLSSGKCHSAFKSLSDRSAKKTTIVIISLNATGEEVFPEKGIEILKERGYADLYQLFLYTRTGDLGEFPEIFASDPLSERQLWNFHDIGQRANQFVMAVRSMPDPEISEVIARRWERVRREISSVNADARFFRFGDPFREAAPKTFSEFAVTDDLIGI